MTTITDADLRRLGFARVTQTAWRKYSSDSTVFVGVRGLFRMVTVEQWRTPQTPARYPHITTAEQLEALCNRVLEAT